MADAEMVFPDKKIFLKPLLIIQLLIAIIGGIVATFAALLSVRPRPPFPLTGVTLSLCSSSRHAASGTDTVDIQSLCTCHSRSCVLTKRNVCFAWLHPNT